MEDRIIRWNELRQFIGLSRGWIFLLERDGKFPRRVAIGPNSVGWKLSEIQQWIDSKPRVELGRKAA